jgi:glycine/D-amino acid oxidase-like deaminating enzyme
MTPALHKIAGDASLPQSADVVVIGGGIAGVAAARELAKRGTSVVLIEKGLIGAEQSCRNWGWCRQQNRDERELPLSIIALRIWDTLRQETGADLGFRRTGLVYASDDEEDIARWDAWGHMARGYDVDTRMCSSAEIRGLLPGHARTWKGGVYSPTDGRAEPSIAAPILAQSARTAGASLHQECAARELEFSAGRVSAVVTEHGTIRCQAVLVAGGAWTGMFLRHHGVPFLQASIQSTSFATKPAPDILSGGLAMPDLSLRRRLDGGYTVGLSGFGKLHLSPMGLRQWRPFWPTFRQRRNKLSFAASGMFFNGPDALQSWKADTVSPFEKNRILSPGPDKRLLRQGYGGIQEAYPALQGVQIDQAWGGMIDCTPDAIPVIAPVKSKPGLFVSSGFSGHGFGLGPGAGQLAADLVLGDKPRVDPEPFRYERMIDGTDLGDMGMM